MPSVEEIIKGTQEKKVERERAVKKILADIKKKREEIKKYVNEFYSGK